MTKAKWIIVNFGKQEQLNHLFYGVQECGREAQVVSMKEFVEMLEVPSDERACIVTTGSIWVNEYTRKQRPNWVGNWHDESLFTCQRYYSFWGKYITQQGYIMLPLAEIERRKDELFAMGPHNEIFIRPSSGAKEFDGSVVWPARFNAWLDEVKMKKNTADLLCVVAPAKELKRELRLVIKGKKVVTGATYRISKNIIQEPLEDSQMDDVVAFAEKVLNDNPPPLPPVHCMDVAIEGDGRISVLEVGCFCCAGLYCCDRRLITQAVSEAAEEEFAKAPANVVS